MSYTFYVASAFIQTIVCWDVSGVTDLSYTFSYASACNQTIGPGTCRA